MRIKIILTAIVVATFFYFKLDGAINDSLRSESRTDVTPIMQNVRTEPKSQSVKPSPRRKSEIHTLYQFVISENPLADVDKPPHSTTEIKYLNEASKRILALEEITLKSTDHQTAMEWVSRIAREASDPIVRNVASEVLQRFCLALKSPSKTLKG
jgi:hypothetical protein